MTVWCDGSVSLSISYCVISVLTEWEVLTADPGAMDTYCDSVDHPLYTPNTFTLIWAAVFLSPHPSFSFLLSCSHSLFAKWSFCLKLPLLSGASITKPKTKQHKQKPKNWGDLIRSVLSCPFWPLLSPLSMPELTLSEWIEICVDVCALNTKMWRGREEREAGSRGGACDWPCPSPAELWTLQSSCLHIQ